MIACLIYPRFEVFHALPDAVLYSNCVYAIPGDQEKRFREAPLPGAQHLHCIKLPLGTVRGCCVSPLVTGGRHLVCR